MADGWETAHGCSSRIPAVLNGFSRALDKASTQSRGSRQFPAPTLRVVPSAEPCHGVAFEFGEDRRDEVLAALLEREGRTFPLRDRGIDLEDGRHVTALVPMYEGKQIIRGKSLREIAQMDVDAVGERGNGVDYIRDIARHLAVAKSSDRAITDVLAEIDRLLGERDAGRM